MSKRVQRFGGEHTVRKQAVVVRYLHSYATALHEKFRISYVDAFAGSGWRIDAAEPPDKEPGLFGPPPAPKPMPGTALQALRLQPRFHRYIYGDTNAGHLAQLAHEVEKLRASGADLPHPEFFHGDANQLIASECKRLIVNPHELAVMFLDPFGMQVSWTTLEAIARSQRADLWLLVPTDIAVNRLIPRHGRVPADFARGLDRFLGSEDWRQAFLVWNKDMFGNPYPVRVASRNEIIGYVMARMKVIFGDGLFPMPLELRIGKRPAYHLVFACSSPSARARELAFRIAKHIMQRAQAGS